jgi:hypothetical protein
MTDVIDIKTGQQFKQREDKEPAFCKKCAYKRELVQLLALTMNILKNFPEPVDYAEAAKID